MNIKCISFILMLFSMGCSSLFDDEIICSSSLVLGITVEIRDSLSGEFVSDLWAFARDGEYADSFYVAPSSDGPALLAPERPGTYEVFITKSGYHSWSVVNIMVAEDEHGCHVETVKLKAGLERISSILIN